MILDRSAQDLSQWRSQMYHYELNKRTKRPFGKQIEYPSHVSHQQIKTKEVMFHPILQNYQKEQQERQNNQANESRMIKQLNNQLKHTLKYQRNYDIVNLSSFESAPQLPHKRNIVPVRNLYNVINNQKLPQIYFKERQIRVQPIKQKKLLTMHQKDYNIVNNVYNHNHKQRLQKQQLQNSKQIQARIQKGRVYDPIFGRFYDQRKEENYQQERQAGQQDHVINNKQQIPISYKLRQPVIIDYSQPASQNLQVLDQIKANSIRRFQTKYALDKQYGQRNQQYDKKYDQVIKNHVHMGRLLDEKARQFDIINLQQYKPTRAQQLFGKKVGVQSWDQLVKQASKSNYQQSFNQRKNYTSIKSKGFK